MSACSIDNENVKTLRFKMIKAVSNYGNRVLATLLAVHFDVYLGAVHLQLSQSPRPPSVCAYYSYSVSVSCKPSGKFSSYCRLAASLYTEH